MSTSSKRFHRIIHSSNRRRGGAGGGYAGPYSSIKSLGDWQMFFAMETQPELTDGTAVVTIDDEFESIGYTAPSVSERATYGTSLQNSLPGLQFDGTDDGAYSNTSDDTTTDIIRSDVWTWFTVFKFDSPSGWQGLYGSTSADILYPFLIILNRTSAGKVNIYSYAGNAYTGEQSTTMSTSTTYFLAYVHDYGNSREEWYLNGVDDSGSMSNVSFSGSGATNPPYIIGDGGFGVSFGGDVFVMGLCKDALSSGNIATMHTTLNDVWSYV